MRDTSSSVVSSDPSFSTTSSTGLKSQVSAETVDRIKHAIEHATHYLPSQGPISIFVHHNTLHSFEDLPFEEAVLAGGAMYDCQPYLSEGRYREALRRGRITLDELRDVLLDDLGDEADDLVASFGTLYTLRLSMLQMPPHEAPTPSCNGCWRNRIC
ncbi:hypothetical protein Poly51_56630 [Rubripirellula tenax]|uniref:Uncharacterized protein n=1 Tax=Rubripirellula tenax TaxID=2528015 RepID=A0A5C6EE42_9BACT|nr:putative inorganic carbon transporter subunit DabA [Rubripirellula tenax]TWU46267.1 hypothetical protein Poly51_56630 [Rubripirellula tenax]